MVVVRVNNEGKMCNSRPCFNCLDIMKAVGINKIYYIDSNNNLICESIKNMVSIQSSSVTKNIDFLKTNVKKTCEEYYCILLKTKFPKQIKMNNFLLFVQYNLSILLPKYYYLIKNNTLMIYNGVGQPIVLSIIY